MGIGSSLLQFVESLRENRPLAPDAPPAVPVRAEAPLRGPDPLAEVEMAVRGSRQRLEALAERLAELKAKAGTTTGTKTGTETGTKSGPGDVAGSRSPTG
jgi:hypothetical protein